MSEQPPERGAIYLEWWRANHRDHGGDAATFARLRRCASPDQALVHSVTMQLVDRMSVRSKRQAAIAGAIAIVLAHVREHQEDRIFPRQLGLLTADQPALSPLRFNALMRAAGVKSQLTALRRALPTIKDKTDVCWLGDGLERLLGFWGEDARERAVIRWSFYYHLKTPPGEEAPDALDTSGQKEPAQ